MEEIAKMLKRFGPRYELNWRMDHLAPYPAMVITLLYFDMRLNKKMQVEHRIPFEEIETLSTHAPRIIEEMQSQIQVEMQDTWGKM